MESLQSQIGLYKELNKVYRSKYTKFSYVQGQVQPITTFSKNDFSMPFKIRGRLLTAGTYKDSELGEFIVSPKDLNKSMKEWEEMKIYTSHKIFQEIMMGLEPSIREVLGKIISTEWNEEEQGIDFFAEIYDEDIARKINAGIINSISAGFAGDIETVMSNNKYSYVRKNIQPKEVSMVFNPRDPRATFQPA